MNIVICEDNLKQLEEITKIIKNYSIMADSEINIVLSTNDPDEVLDYIQNQKADCFFLDIDLNHELTGIELASQIREKDPICSIVFITTHAEMTSLTFIYKIAALDFIIKDEQDTLRNKVLSALQEANKRYHKIGEDTSMNKLQLKVSGRTRHIDYDDIYFFEASPNLHKIILHLKNEQIEFYGRLKTYENLSDSFYRCHKSFIVNKNLIQEVDSKNRIVTMINGETCFASSRLIKGLLLN